MEGKYFVIDPSSHDEPLGYLEMAFIGSRRTEILS